MLVSRLLEDRTEPFQRVGSCPPAARLPGEGEAFLKPTPSFGQIALLRRGAPQVEERHRRAPGISRGVMDLQAFAV